MIKEIKLILGMTDKEIMYVVASEYIDDICSKAVEEAEKIMENPILRSMICQAAEQILRYQKYRKSVILGETDDKFWYECAQNDARAYKTVLYDNLFHNYGPNDHDI